MINSTGMVVGVDIGCSPKRRSSAIGALSWTDSEIYWRCERFRALEPEREQTIAGFVGGHSILSAAFDGPLRRGFDVIGRYRVAERMLTRRIQPLIGKPGQSNSPVGIKLNIHANACVGHVAKHGLISKALHGCAIDQRAVVEAFPNAFLGLMIERPTENAVRRSNRSDIFFRVLSENGRLQALLSYCLPGRVITADLAQIKNHDERAAFVCALTALCVAKGDFVAVGDDDGWIVLPPRHFIQQEQFALLELNAVDERQGSLHIGLGAD